MASKVLERPWVRTRTKSRRSTRNYDNANYQVDPVPDIRIDGDDRSPFQLDGTRYSFEAYEDWDNVHRREYALLRRPELPIQHHRTKSAGDAQVISERERLGDRKARRERYDRDYYSDEPPSPVMFDQRPRDESSEDRFGRLTVDDHAVSDNTPSASDDEITPLAALCVRCEKDLERASRFCMNLDSAAIERTSQQSVLERLALNLSDQAFRLHIWASEAQIDTLPPSAPNDNDDDDEDEDESVELAYWTLTRLRSRTKRLAATCAKLERSADAEPPNVSELDLDEDRSDNEVSRLPARKTGADLEQDVKGVDFQLLTLQTLTRAVREAQAPDFTSAIQAHVKEVKMYFGTVEACNVYEPSEAMPRDAALRAARKIAAGLA